MGLYRRHDSPFWWATLERKGQRPAQRSTRVPVDGGTALQTRLNKDLAQAVYAAWMGDIARGVYGLDVAKPEITFSAFREWYEKEVVPTKRNKVRDASMLRQLGRYFDPRRLHTLTKKDAHEWMRERAKEVSSSTVNRELIRMKSLLSLAVPQYLESNPWSRVSALDTDEFEPVLLTPEDEKKMLALADPVEKAVIICALDTLQRLGTVAAFARSEDHDAYLTVLRPKGRGRRVPYRVPISGRLRDALDALPDDGALYFSRYHCPSSRTQKPPSAEAVRKRVEDMIQGLAEKAEVKFGRKAGGITFHSLRHTGASRMLNGGVDLKTVAEIGNWKDLAVLQRYLHPLGDAREKAVEVVGGLRLVDAKKKQRGFAKKTA